MVITYVRAVWLSCDTLELSGVRVMRPDLLANPVTAVFAFETPHSLVTVLV
jgi:hypothetical protein